MPQVLHFARLGQPVVHERAQEIDPTSSDAKEIIENMLHTMDVRGPMFGLAAPQVHIPYRIAIFEVRKDPIHTLYKMTPEYDPDGVPQTILINPVIEVLSTETTVDWEACLSVPGLMGLVERPHSIRYTWQSVDGKTHAREAHGFHARCVQHECDHLDGITYNMRMTDLSSLYFREEGVKYQQHKSKI